jgi:hypothetical protein
MTCDPRTPKSAAVPLWEPHIFQWQDAVLYKSRNTPDTPVSPVIGFCSCVGDSSHRFFFWYTFFYVRGSSYVKHIGSACLVYVLLIDCGNMYVNKDTVVSWTGQYTVERKWAGFWQKPACWASGIGFVCISDTVLGGMMCECRMKK